MTDCFQAFTDNYSKCTQATGGVAAPLDRTSANVNDRYKVCSTPACQTLISAYIRLIGEKCLGALTQLQNHPKGMEWRDYCPLEPDPTSASPSPTGAPPSPPSPPSPPTSPSPPTTPSTPGSPPSPTTTSPPGTPTTPSPPGASPAPSTSASSGSSSAAPDTTSSDSPARTPSPDASTVSIDSSGTDSTTTASSSSANQPSDLLNNASTLPPQRTATPAEGQSLSPTSAPELSDTTGLNTTTVVAVVAGGVVTLLLVVIIVLLVRRRNQYARPEPLLTIVTNEKERGSFTQDEDTVSGSSLLHGSLALAAFRIPFKHLQQGDVISQGGFGEVVRGSYSGRVVAIKRLLASRRKDPHNIQSFFKEIQLTATLDHECLVRFIGVSWDIPANLCMVSEFMQGGDLRTLLAGYAKSGHPNGLDDTKLRIANQLAHVLTYLHTLATPVVHRDLKSRNVLLNTSLDAKLIDFGISCERQDVTMTAGVGTSLWMAPEVMLGKRYDEKADVFSFGVILSELDTHALPYDHARDTTSNRMLADMVLMQMISQGELTPRFTAAADPAIVALARECLRVDPAQRPTASEVLYRIHKSRNPVRTWE